MKVRGRGRSAQKKQRHFSRGCVFPSLWAAACGGSTRPPPERLWGRTEVDNAGGDGLGLGSPPSILQTGQVCIPRGGAGVQTRDLTALEGLGRSCLPSTAGSQTTGPARQGPMTHARAACPPCPSPAGRTSVSRL